jgi:pimeloyl-ACP methyl ester carboxylesterase
MWGHLASPLIEDHMVVAPDLRGLGLSSKPDAGYDKQNQAADVMGILDALGVRTAELVTHDIGIMVGSAVAATHPERVSRWVAVDAPLPGVGPWDQTLRIRPCGTLASVVRTWSAWSPAASASISTASGTNFPGTRSGSMKRSANIMRRSMHNRRNASGLCPVPSVQPGQMPVLAFVGEATFGPMIGAVMRCVADNVKDVIIPDCGHWITEEQPQATTDLVVDFLHRR